MSTRHSGGPDAATVAIIVNGEPRSVPVGTTAAAVVERFGFAGRPVAVEVDGEVVPRARLADRGLVGGERIEIVTFVGGG